jgi:predicted RNA polymerase sigma factor
VGSYLWEAVADDLHRRAGKLEQARSHRARALDLATTQAKRDLLGRRLAT